MLPTRPRLAARSTTSSCTWPAVSTATRVSCGVTLTRISSLMGFSCGGVPDPLEQLRRLLQRQSDYAGKAAAQLGDKARRPALDAVGPCLVLPFAACHVRGDFLIVERFEPDFRNRDRAFDAGAETHRERRQHLVQPSGKRAEHFGRL